MTLLWRVPVLNTRWVNVETGPKFLSQKLVGPAEVAKFRVLSHRDFHPVTYAGRKALLQYNCYNKSCQDRFPSAYGIHLLSQEDTWWNHIANSTTLPADHPGIARLTQLLRDVRLHNARVSVSMSQSQY